jgi:hypothetical protein
MKKALLLCLALLLLGFATAVPHATASGCCPILCRTDSDCNSTCGVGLGRCVGGTTCCRVCLCSPGGS